MSVARLMQQAAAGVSGGGGDGDFTSATYVSNYAIPSVTTNLRGVAVSSDETKLLFIDVTSSPDDLSRIEMTTAGDLSTASVANSSTIGTGTKSSIFIQTPSILWALDASFDNIKKYTLNADFGNAVSSTATYSVPAGFNPIGSDNPWSLTFNQDGTKMFIGDFNADGIQEFSLSTAYDPSTATYTANGSVAAQTGTPYAQCWNNDGSKMYVIETGAGSSVLYQYSLSSTYDVTTLSYDGSLALTAGPLATGYAFGVSVSDDNQSLYISGLLVGVSAYIIKYSTVTPASSWTDPDLANASYDSVSFSVSSQEASPVGLFFSPDGDNCYVIGFTGKDVNEYSLSTSWDITSASFVSSLSVSAKDSFPRDLWFKDDGTELYIVGTSSNSVHQYTLSTAWDVSSGTFTQSFSVSSQSSFTRGLTFKPDGTKMFTLDSSSDNSFQYSLSTAWDISTASYDSKSLATGTPNPTAPRFNPDGTKLWLIDNSPDDVRQYSLSTAWDLSTGSYDSVLFSVGSQEAAAQGLFFKDDGQKMYVVGTTNDTIYQYST